MDAIIAQEPILKRTKRFIEKYGVKNIWLAEHVKIPAKTFSTFYNGRYALSAPQLERLIAFLDEYERRMVGFLALEN